jgi:hypothetical protein
MYNETNVIGSTRNNSERMEDSMFPIQSMTHKIISQLLYKQV